MIATLGVLGRIFLILADVLERWSLRHSRRLLPCTLVGLGRLETCRLVALLII